MLSCRHTFVCGCAASQWLDTRMTVSERMKCSIPGISLFVHLHVIMWNQRIDMGTVWPGMGTVWPDTVWESNAWPWCYGNRVSAWTLQTLARCQWALCYHGVGIAAVTGTLPRWCLCSVCGIGITVVTRMTSVVVTTTFSQIDDFSCHDNNLFSDFRHSSVTLASKLWHYQVGKNDVKTDCDRFGPLFSLFNTFCFSKHKNNIIIMKLQTSKLRIVIVLLTFSLNFTHI